MKIYILSTLDQLFFIVDFGVEFIVIFDHVLGIEWKQRLNVFRVLLLDLCVELLPLLIEFLSFLLVHLDRVLLLLLWIHFQSLIESKWVYLLKDCLESDQRLLQDLVPMVLG